jgi:pyruvate dehydrogenase E2 component (dihydrolipoamide acetyltransferase)
LNEGTLLYIGIQKEKQHRRFFTCYYRKEGEDVAALGQSALKPKQLNLKLKSYYPSENYKRRKSTAAESASLPKGVVVVTMPRLRIL